MQYGPYVRLYVDTEKSTNLNFVYWYCDCYTGAGATAISTVDDVVDDDVDDDDVSPVAHTCTHTFAQ